MEKHEGKLLHEWHNWVIYEDYEKVDDLERKTIEAWRERTYNNFNPIDSPSRDLLNSSDEIEMHIRMVAEQ